MVTSRWIIELFCHQILENTRPCVRSWVINYRRYFIKFNENLLQLSATLNPSAWWSLRNFQEIHKLRPSRMSKFTSYIEQFQLHSNDCKMTDHQYQEEMMIRSTCLNQSSPIVFRDVQFNENDEAMKTFANIVYQKDMEGFSSRIFLGSWKFFRLFLLMVSLQWNRILIKLSRKLFQIKFYEIK